MQVSLGPGHIVLDGDPAPLPQRGTAPFPISGPYLLRPNGCIDQDMSLGMELGLGPGDFVLDGDPAPLPKKGGAPSQKKKSAHAYCGQTAVWIKMPLGTEVGLGPGHIVLNEDPAPPKMGTAPNFRPGSVVAKRSRCHFVRR